MTGKEKQAKPEQKSAIRDKFTTFRNNVRDALSFEGDCDCEEEWDDLLDQVDTLEATLRALMPMMKALEKKMGDMEAKVDVLQKAVGELKGETVK